MAMTGMSLEKLPYITFSQGPLSRRARGPFYLPFSETGKKGSNRGRRAKTGPNFCWPRAARKNKRKLARKKDPGIHFVCVPYSCRCIVQRTSQYTYRAYSCGNTFVLYFASHFRQKNPPKPARTKNPKPIFWLRHMNNGDFGFFFARRPFLEVFGSI